MIIPFSGIIEPEPPWHTSPSRKWQVLRMLLRNCRDGFVSARMLDIKMGNVTAVGGWQGKGSVKAFMQSLGSVHRTRRMCLTRSR